MTFNQMEILKFKTNVKNEADVSKVAALLDQEESISKWIIDTATDENILSVSGEKLNPQTVENALQEAGFEAEILRVIGIGGEDL